MTSNVHKLRPSNMYIRGELFAGEGGKGAHYFTEDRSHSLCEKSANASGIFVKRRVSKIRTGAYFAISPRYRRYIHVLHSISIFLAKIKRIIYLWVAYE